MKWAHCSAPRYWLIYNTHLCTVPVTIQAPTLGSWQLRFSGVRRLKNVFDNVMGYSANLREYYHGRGGRLGYSSGCVILREAKRKIGITGSEIACPTHQFTHNHIAQQTQGRSLSNTRIFATSVSFIKPYSCSQVHCISKCRRAI